MTSDTPWPNFWAEELDCKCNGSCGITWRNYDLDFMGLIQYYRTQLNFPFNVSSGIRCNAYDDSLGGARAHTIQIDGRAYAVDIAISGMREYDLIDFVMRTHYSGNMQKPIRGIGRKQHGPHSGRFVHLDSLPSRSDRRIVEWTYP